MRILHVSHRYWPHTGGSERHLQALCERLARDGHDVTVYTTDAFDLELFWNPSKGRVNSPADTHNGVKIRRFPVRHLPASHLTFGGLRHLMTQLSSLPFNVSALLRRLSAVTPWVPDLAAALSDSSDFDVVHGMNIGFEGLLWPALLAAERRQVPFVITPLLHLGEEETGGVRAAYTMRHQIELIARSSAVLSQTEIEQRFLIDAGVDCGKIVRTGVGVEPEEVTGGVPGRFRAKYGIQRPFVCCLGTNAFDKGTFHLVEAMALLWQKGLDADLVVAGPKMDAFERYYSGQPDWIKRRCHVLGVIPEDDKNDLLAATEVMAMPSRTDSFGVVYLEAWLYSKPVVGARAGGVPEVINDGIDGYIVEFGDVDSLGGRIEALLSDGEAARAMGERGREKVMERYTWDHVYPVARDVFLRATEGRMGARV